MLAHQSSIQGLVHVIIWTPVVTNYVICDSLNEFRLQVINSPIISEVRVGECAQPFGIIDIQERVIRSQRIHGNQVYDSLLPSVWPWKLQVLNSSLIIILDFMQGTLVGHEPLSMNEVHWINLEANKVRMVGQK